MPKTLLQQIVAETNALQALFDEMRTDQLMGRRIAQGARDAWTKRFDEVFQHEMPEAQEDRLIKLQSDFLQHFRDVPTKKSKSEPVSK